MSMKLMVRVLEEIDVPRNQQLVLLSMAENARDDGTKCFPSVDLIAWKAGYKPRAVVDIIRDLRKSGVLEVVEDANARRPTEYTIHLDKAPQKLAFDEWQKVHGRHPERAKRDVSLARENAPRNQFLSGETAPVQNDEGCNLTSLGVQSHVINGPLARENAPEPVNEPVKNQSSGFDATLSVVNGENTSRPPAVKGDSPAHRLVNRYYDIVGGVPTDHGKDLGHAKTLIKAGVTADNLPEYISWLRGNWRAKTGFNLTTAVNAVNEWHSIKSAPKPLRRLVV
jgi:hypothetical protein